MAKSLIAELRPENEDALVEQALEALLAQQPIIVPTDTVYGIACLATPHNPAYERIYELKQRPYTLPLPLLVASKKQAEQLAHMTPLAQRLARQGWPGALTLVLEAHASKGAAANEAFIAREYLAKDGSVALRVPASSFLQKLIDKAGVPLATTSANVHGMPPAIAREFLSERLLEQVAYTIIKDGAMTGQASKIIDARKKRAHLIRN